MKFHKMKNYRIRNKILDYIYEHQRRHTKLYREQTQDPGYSHVFLNQMVHDLNLTHKQVETNIRWLELQGEVAHKQFEEGLWGYGLTKKGKARISEPYTGNIEEDRTLNRRLTWLNLLKILIGIIVIIFPVLQLLINWIFDFNLWGWLNSFFK